MNIEVNGENKRVPEPMSVSDLLAHLGVNNPMAMVELNGDVLTRDQFGETMVTDGARVEIITLMGGGA